jgi:hypothetical protein
MTAMPNPYAAMALDYFDAGSGYPLPLGGPKGKTPLVRGWHGDNPFPEREQIEEWVRRYPNANIGLRLPKHVIGIDVDCYDGKPGAATIAEHVELWGELPPTWVSTSRTDGSGIRLYRVPEGLAWPGELGAGVEIIHWANRFVVAAPSIHHTGRVYRWTSPTGAEDEFPEAGDL